MGLLQRAVLYIRRKRGKTVTLFCILLIFSTFMLTGLSNLSVLRLKPKEILTEGE